MTARIVSPVSRQLSVADVDRSIAFYRDVLGFEARRSPVAEVVSGAARIELTPAPAAYDSTGDQRPRGAAILFFETDDVGGMHDDVIRRGGQASELEKVNWIKMRVFQTRDPDDHTLWFAQSFQEPELPRDPKRQLRQLLPMLPLDDIAAGIAYYQQALGFHINYAQADLGVMDRDDVTLLLIKRTQDTGIGSCEAYINDADALHAELVQRGANVQGAPVSHPWGLRDFTVLDPEGNRLIFAQTFE